MRIPSGSYIYFRFSSPLGAVLMQPAGRKVGELVHFRDIVSLFDRRCNERVKAGVPCNRVMADRIHEARTATAALIRYRIGNSQVAISGLPDEEITALCQYASGLLGEDKA